MSNKTRGHVIRKWGLQKKLRELSKPGVLERTSTGSAPYRRRLHVDAAHLFHPLVNIIAVFYWALSSSANRNKKSLAQVLIVWALIAMLLGFFLLLMVTPFIKESYHWEF